MKAAFKLFTPAAVLATCVTIAALASDWPTEFHDPANTMNTPAVLGRGDQLKVLWSAPAGGTERPAPVVYRNMVVSGNFIYDAFTGHLLGSLPDADLACAITNE